jgi:hypothetical protein
MEKEASDKPRKENEQNKGTGEDQRIIPSGIPIMRVVIRSM